MIQRSVGPTRKAAETGEGRKLTERSLQVVVVVVVAVPVILPSRGASRGVTSTGSGDEGRREEEKE